MHAVHQKPMLVEIDGTNAKKGKVANKGKMICIIASLSLSLTLCISSDIYVYIYIRTYMYMQVYNSCIFITYKLAHKKSQLPKKSFKKVSSTSP